MSQMPIDNICEDNLIAKWLETLKKKKKKNQTTDYFTDPVMKASK